MAADAHRRGRRRDGVAMVTLPATKTAVAQSPSPLQLQLARSLACYVSEDDAELDRKSFISTVIDRIQLDLYTGEY